MRIYLISLLCISTIGCITLSFNQSNKVNVENKPSIKTSIFTYHIDPESNFQNMALVAGTLEWNNGCIFLKSKETYYTPMFPDAFTKWDEASKTITLDGHKFRMGDFIETNGAYTIYEPNTGNGLELQGSAKCLKRNIAGIGTLGLTK